MDRVAPHAPNPEPDSLLEDEPVCETCGRALDVAFVHPWTDDGTWRCASQDAEHWPVRDDDPLSPCGYCGWEPDA